MRRDFPLTLEVFLAFPLSSEGLSAFPLLPEGLSAFPLSLDAITIFLFDSLLPIYKNESSNRNRKTLISGRISCRVYAIIPTRNF